MGFLDLFRRRGGPDRGDPSAPAESPAAPPEPDPEPPAGQPVELVPAEPPAVNAAARERAHRVVDQLRLLHPAATGEVQVVAECRDGRMRVPRMQVEAVGDHELPACVVVDPFLHTAFLASEIGHLLGALGQSTAGWSTVSLSAYPDRLTLLGASIPIEEPALCFGELFQARLRQADPAIEQRQDALQSAMMALGPCSISWERDRGALRFVPEAEPPALIRAEVLGSFSPERHSWAWAWANRSFDSDHTRGITAVRDRAEDRSGGRVLRNPGCDCSEPFAFALAHLAADLLGERPIWRWPLPSGVQLFFAMVEPSGWLR